MSNNNNEQKQEWYLYPITRDYTYNSILDQYTSVIDGTLAFICPHCGHIVYMPKIYDKHIYKSGINEYINLQYSVTCGLCGKPFTTTKEYDPNIVEAIADLNHKGYVTHCCCEGHVYSDGTYYQPFIMFMTNDIRNQYPVPPEGWIYSADFGPETGMCAIEYVIPQKCMNNIIENQAHDESWKADAMQSLYTWISIVKSKIDADASKEEES